MDCELLNNVFSAIKNDVTSCATRTYFISLCDGCVTFGLKSPRRRRRGFKKDIMRFYRAVPPPSLSHPPPEILREKIFVPEILREKIFVPEKIRDTEKMVPPLPASRISVLDDLFCDNIEICRDSRDSNADDTLTGWSGSCDDSLIVPPRADIVEIGARPAELQRDLTPDLASRIFAFFKPANVVVADSDDDDDVDVFTVLSEPCSDDDDIGLDYECDYLDESEDYLPKEHPFYDPSNLTLIQELLKESKTSRDFSHLSPGFIKQIIPRCDLDENWLKNHPD